MISKPRMRLQRQTTRQHHTTRTRQHHSRTQQRMPRRLQTQHTRLEHRPRRLQPKTLTLESVGREVDAGGAHTLESNSPVHTDTMGPRLPQTGEEGLDLGAAGAQDGRENTIRKRFRTHTTENTIGTELDENGDAPVTEGLNTVGEPDRTTDMTHPVVRRTELVGGSQNTGDIGDHRDPRSLIAQTLRNRAEFVQHPI
ncbi:hypothetical protein, partial [Streptomyces sp. ISL-11]|uniref:hypothetical protein n=1 Tax=Streptomyces sp. ISL-11 TaxID=2819174 RepID=UPI0020357673